MSKKNYIYTITALEVGYKYINKNRSPDGTFHSYHKKTNNNQRKIFVIKSNNTTGWFSNLKDATDSVLFNDVDLHEQSNQYVVIEKLLEGPFSCIEGEQWWFKWEGTHEKGKYKSCSAPTELKNIIGFWGHKSAKEAE